VVAFSPDGKRLVTASQAHDQTARIWDVATGRCLQVLVTATGIPTAEFSPDGKLVLTAGGAGGARIWDASDGRRLYSLPRDRGGYLVTDVEDARFSPDGRRVVTVTRLLYASKDAAAQWRSTVEIWDVATGRTVQTLAIGTFAPNGAVFSPDGRLVLIRGDVSAELWDAASGRKLHRFPGSGAVFSPNGRLIATAHDGGVQIWDVTTGRKVHALPGRTGEPFFGPDGKLLVTTGGTIWDVASGRSVRTLAGDFRKAHVGSFSRDGKLLLSWGDDGTARTWDVASGRTLRTLS
jgi:WD40 repeat protein